MQVIIKSLMTSYDSVGDGPAILILHGWGDSRHAFDNMAKTLSKKFKVITLDLPGFGETQSPQEAWGLDDYANFVKAFAEKLDLKVKAIIGHSNGGAIAVRGFAKDTLNAEKLILLAPSGIRDIYQGRKKILRLAAKTAKYITKPLPNRARSRLKRNAYKKIGSDLFVAEHLQETFKKIVTDDVRNDAAKLKLPVLIIYGSDDTATPPRFGQMYRDLIHGSKLEIIEGADHFLHLSHKEKVAREIEEFVL